MVLCEGVRRHPGGAAHLQGATSGEAARGGDEVADKARVHEHEGGAVILDGTPAAPRRGRCHDRVVGEHRAGEDGVAVLEVGGTSGDPGAVVQEQGGGRPHLTLGIEAAPGEGCPATDEAHVRQLEQAAAIGLEDVATIARERPRARCRAVLRRQVRGETTPALAEATRGAPAGAPSMVSTRAWPRTDPTSTVAAGEAPTIATPARSVTTSEPRSST